MSLYDVIMGYVQDDFDERGIDFDVPEYNSVRSPKAVVKDMMAAFSAKYPDKGYLIVVDEFLSYLSSRNEREIVLDLEFFRALGEMCSKSKLRVIFGVQEKIFDNPRFSFVSDNLKHVSDRFTQMIITKEATSYVVSERILKKTPEQKALIRKHLEKFSMLYTGMSSRMDEFVDLFPIHPSYIDVFNKIYLIENRHILKNISMTIRDIFNRDVPENEPGIISFDNYWPAIKSNGLLKSDVTINRVVTASGQLEDIINRAFPKPAYKPLAIKIIYALSVHRLTTNGLDVHFGLTAENLKDDLCLFLTMPEQDADFLLALIKTTLKDIMTTVSGQFIIYNDANNQYYIDVDKVVDYDEKIKQKASIMADGELNRYFYQLIYSCLDWDAKQFVQFLDMGITEVRIIIGRIHHDRLSCILEKIPGKLLNGRKRNRQNDDILSFDDFRNIRRRCADLLCKRPDGFLPSRIGHADLMTGLHELLRQSPADMPDTNDTYIHIHASYILKVLYILYTRGKREGTGETNYSSE